MTGSRRMKSIALATSFASVTFFTCGMAAAQTPNVAGPVREYQAPAPAPSPPRTRPLREGVTQYGVGGVAPRFIVEAVSFKAVNESGRDLPYTSDEVFAEFHGGGNFMMTSNVHQVDTGDTEQFAPEQSCIWPAIDSDGRQNGRWACDPQGRAGPIQFYIALYDDDNELGYPFRICFGGGADLSVCSVLGQNDILFEHTFNYEVSDVLQRLDPSCRCLVQTAREAVDDLTEYEVTFRITRVDNAAQQPGMATFEDDPVVYRSGSLVARYQPFDLDAGTVGVAAGGDFSFSRAGANYFLTPSNNAKIWVGGASARGYATCFAQRASANYIATQVGVPAVGDYACYLTSDGRVGELQVASITPSSFGGQTALGLTYTTWQ